MHPLSLPFLICNGIACIRRTLSGSTRKRQMMKERKREGGKEEVQRQGPWVAAWSSMRSGRGEN